MAYFKKPFLSAQKSASSLFCLVNRALSLSLCLRASVVLVSDASDNLARGLLNLIGGQKPKPVYCSGVLRIRATALMSAPENTGMLKLSSRLLVPTIIATPSAKVAAAAPAR